MESPKRLTFAWWNLHNFAHFDLENCGQARWPKQISDYEGKRDRILAVLGGLCDGDWPDLVAVCEMTHEAAADLLTRRPADLGVFRVVEAGYPIQRWFTLESWETHPETPDNPHPDIAGLEGNFHGILSRPSSKLVVLINYLRHNIPAANPH